MKRSGRKSAAQTPAPSSERIKGSSINPVGSASSKDEASKIVLGDSIIKVLREKADKFNEEHPRNKVGLSELKAVMRRGMGAYSSSHRPTITGGRPNSRTAWGYARVNKFLQKKAGKPVKKAYVQDDDLLIAANGSEIPNGSADMEYYSNTNSDGWVDAMLFLAKRILGENYYNSASLGYWVSGNILIRIKDHFSNVYNFDADIEDRGITTIVDIILPLKGQGDNYNTDFDEYVTENNIRGLQYYVEDGEWLSDVAKKVKTFMGEADMKYAKGGLLAPNGKPSNLTPEQYKLVRTPEFKAWFGDWENDPENASKVVDSNGEPLIVYHGTDKKFTTFKVGYAEGWGSGIYTTDNKESAAEFGDQLYTLFANIRKPITDYLLNNPPKELYRTTAFRNAEKKKMNEMLDMYSGYKGHLDITDEELASFKLEYFGLADQTLKDMEANPERFRLIDLAELKQDDITLTIDIYKELKYDGIMAYESNNIDGYEIVAFEPNQLKLADGSNTNFDAENPDIQYNDGGVIDEEAQLYIDIISMNPKAPVYDKYKELLKTKFNIDYDSEYANRDEEIIENADLNNLKSKNDFLDYQNYVKYCRKIFQLRGFNKNQPKHIEGIVTLELAKRIGKVLGFEVEFKNYNGSGNYAESIGETIRIPQNVDINTFIHEIGHFFDHEFSKEYEGKAKNSVYATSPYIIGKSDEVFAENFMTYFIAPDWLKNNMPVVYYELDEKIPETYKITINNLIETVNGEIKKEGLRYEQGGLLAPNGKPSNLTPEQYKLVRTPEFKAWFGDWENDPENASKVVDENGEPLVVYHYTNSKNIQEFYPFAQDLLNGNKTIEEVKDIIRRWKKSNGISLMDFRAGTFFTPKRGAYSSYGNVEYACFLKGKFILNTGEFNEGDKYVGKPSMESPIWYYWNEKNLPEIVALYPEQIKLADGSNTTFDENNPDIRYDGGGKVDLEQSPFAAWFKNSKVVDKNGKPLIVYHGSPDLTEFKETYIFKRKFNEGQEFFFTDNYSMAKSYADPKRAFDYQNAEEGIIPAYLSLQNPLIVDAENQIWRRFEVEISGEKLFGTRSVMKYARNNGYDGVIIKNVRDYYEGNERRAKGGNVYVAFSPNQIKLADGSNTTFDADNPDIRYDLGGASDFGKVISASSRFRPYETIVFDPPLVGINGAKLISYTWSYEWDMEFSIVKGELVAVRKSDWTQADISADTGREIVHKYDVQLPNGEVKTVSSDSVPILLGYLDRKQKTNFPNLANAAKTLAKQKLQLSILEAKIKERKDAINAIIAKGFPEVKVENHFFRGYKFTMGDGIGGCYGDDPNDKERFDCAKNNYINEELKKLGIEPFGSYDTYDLKNRIERQERKIKEILTSQVPKTENEKKQENNQLPLTIKDSVLFNGFYLDFREISPEINYTIVTYNPNQKKTDSVLNTVNSSALSEILMDRFNLSSTIAKFAQIQYAKYAQKVKPETIFNEPFLVINWDEVVFDSGKSYAKGGLIAPNGKPSNLTPEQYKLVRTPEFKAWFGDWENDPENASKVVDENGEPLVCFHGTNSNFYEFDSKYLGISNDRGFYGQGFYFTFQPINKYFHYSAQEAATYGNRILPCFIKAINPFDFSNLLLYNGHKINYSNKSFVFLSNLVKRFPDLGKVIELGSTIYDTEKDDYIYKKVSISILPKLIEKYSNELTMYVTDNGWGERNIKSGYVKSRVVEYDYRDKGGKKGSYLDFESLGNWEFKIKDGIQYPSDEEIKIGLICEAIEKYDGIKTDYFPEGYMTRYDEITNKIKNEYDCIMQSMSGDEIVVFKPEQIKLADGSNTTFDADNPDIRYGEGGGIQTGTNVTYPQPPADLSAYIRANDYWDAIRKFYFETKDGQPLSSRFQPYLGELPPVGSWRIDTAKLMDGRFIDYLMEMPIDFLIPKELDSAGKLNPTKRGDDERYAEWIKAGFRSIPIEVVQTDKGNFVITDGHRRYLAHKLAGKDTIEAWVSFTVQSPRGTPVGLTYELAHPNNRIPLLETGGAIKEPNDLTFASYEDALHWINHRSKNFDNKNSFYASVEYKQMYPEVVELYKIEQSKHRERAKLAMQQAGIDFGDRVMFDLVNYLQVETFTGTIVNRGGIPYVKLDDGQQTMSGQKSVKWHKGWKKMDNYDKSDE